MAQDLGEKEVEEGERTLGYANCPCTQVDARLLKGFIQTNKNVWHPLAGSDEDFMAWQ